MDKNLNKGNFTISLDCEGLWGMADKEAVVNSGIINDQSLKGAYYFINDVLCKNNLRSTAAFVTCFGSKKEAVLENSDMLIQMASINPRWFVNILSAIKSNSLDGWCGAEFYELLFRAGHEMAWHGTTHLPLSDLTSSEAVALEIELAGNLFHDLGHVPRTIVFPRNQIGHLDLLRKSGYYTYRDSLQRSAIERFLGLMSEYNIYYQSDMELPSLRDGWDVLPAGNFLNWPSGARAIVPTRITVIRWKNMLRMAAESGSYVHMWFHPHNLITAPSMKIAFLEIIKYAGELVKSGHISNLTMAEAREHYNLELVV